MGIYITKLGGKYYSEVGNIPQFKEDDLGNAIIYCIADRLSSEVGLSSKKFLKDIFKSDVLPEPDNEEVVQCTSLADYKKQANKIIDEAKKLYDEKLGEVCIDIIRKIYIQKVERSLTKATVKEKKLYEEKNREAFFEEILDKIIEEDSQKYLESLAKDIKMLINNLTDTDLNLMNLSMVKLPADEVIDAMTHVKKKLLEAFTFDPEELYDANEIIEYWMSTAATQEQKELLNTKPEEENKGEEEKPKKQNLVSFNYDPVNVRQNQKITSRIYIDPLFMVKDQEDANKLEKKLELVVDELINKVEKKFNNGNIITLAIASYPHYTDADNFELSSYIIIPNANPQFPPMLQFISPLNELQYYAYKVKDGTGKWFGPTTK